MNRSIAVVAHREKLTGGAARRLRAALQEHGLDDVPWYSIEKGSRAAAATKKAVKRGAEVVLVCGGDGTVRSASESLTGTDAALAVVPAGTANLFATGLDLPRRPADVVAAIVGGRTILIDSAKCNDRGFNVMAGTGFDAGMIDAADRGKARLGTLSYVWAGVREARHREAFGAEVEVDGREVFEGPATCVLVANIGSLKGGIEAFPDASPTDGKLDLAVITADGMREWAGLMARAVRGTQRWAGNAHFDQGATIRVRLDGKHRFELDGGSKGVAKRLDFSVDEAALRVCVAPTAG